MVADTPLTRPPRPFRKPTGDFMREKAGDRKPFKPKPWSHQRDLEALKGKPIEWTYINGACWWSGTLLEADQFALKVEIWDGVNKSVMTVFKHDLRAFRPQR